MAVKPGTPVYIIMKARGVASPNVVSALAKILKARRVKAHKNILNLDQPKEKQRQMIKTRFQTIEKNLEKWLFETGFSSANAETMIKRAKAELSQK